MNLNAKAWLGLIVLAFVMATLLFVSAGTLHYWQAWVYLAVFFGASVFHTLYLMKHDPALLQRRLKGGPTTEKERAQQIIMLGTSIGFIALLVVPGLDHFPMVTCSPATGDRWECSDRGGLLHHLPRL